MSNKITTESSNKIIYDGSNYEEVLRFTKMENPLSDYVVINHTKKEVEIYSCGTVGIIRARIGDCIVKCVDGSLCVQAITTFN